MELLVLYLISFAVGGASARSAPSSRLAKAATPPPGVSSDFLFSIVALIVIVLLPSTGREPIG